MLLQHTDQGSYKGGDGEQTLALNGEPCTCRLRQTRRRRGLAMT